MKRKHLIRVHYKDSYLIIILCRSINRQISKISWRLRQLVNYCLLAPNLDLCSPLPGAGLGCCKTNICFARWLHVGLCWKGILHGQNITLFLVCFLQASWTQHFCWYCPKLLQLSSSNLSRQHRNLVHSFSSICQLILSCPPDPQLLVPTWQSPSSDIWFS